MNKFDRGRSCRTCFADAISARTSPNTQKNKAKYRDGKEHFEELNIRLKRNKKNWTYHFYFLSPENYSDFYQAIRDGKYKGWKSQLMQDLE